MGLFNAPDFAGHPGIISARYSNIFSIITINSILTLFIIRLNHKTEDELYKTVLEKDLILNELQGKTRELEQNKAELETNVEERTKEIQEQRDTLQQQNEEKAVLLKEVHHRVKNNLQIIASLINLKLANLEDENTTNALKEMQYRVLSMALVHTKMYETSNFKEISLNSYCSQLIDNIREIYADQEFEYQLNIPDHIKLDMETTIPVGLILNEIISNFFKHVLDTKNGNTFSITIDEVPGEYYKVLYNDNGNGFSTEFNLNNTKSLGMQLIESLADQIDGQFDFSNNDGAQYDFTIPIKFT